MRWSATKTGTSTMIAHDLLSHCRSKMVYFYVKSFLHMHRTRQPTYRNRSHVGVPLLRPQTRILLLNLGKLKYLKSLTNTACKNVSTKVRLFVRWWCAIFPRAFVPILLRLYGSAERHWNRQFCTFIVEDQVSSFQKCFPFKMLSQILSYS